MNYYVNIEKVQFSELIGAFLTSLLVLIQNKKALSMKVKKESQSVVCEMEALTGWLLCG